MSTNNDSDHSYKVHWYFRLSSLLIVLCMSSCMVFIIPLKIVYRLFLKILLALTIPFVHSAWDISCSSFIPYHNRLLKTCRVPPKEPFTNFLNQHIKKLHFNKQIMRQCQRIFYAQCFSCCAFVYSSLYLIYIYF